MPGKKKKESKEPQSEVQAEPVEQSGPGVLSQKVKAMTELPLEETERKMITGALELGQKTVKEIMVPRPEIASAEENSTVEQIRQLIFEKGHSRIPLYQGEIDKITGILHLRDLFVAMGKSEPVNLKKIARKPYFVPDGKRVADLLAEMRKEKTHIAIVVDEYGGIAGLVTIEDILEEVVGEIEDEYVKEEQEIQKVDEHTLLVKGKVGLKEINEALGTKLPEKEFESVGGFIYDLVGGVPEQGKTVKHKNLKFTVEKVSGQRIKWVRVSRGK